MSVKNQKPKPRKYLSSDERKQEILAAAFDAFSDDSYSSVTIEQIARHVGLSKAGVYAHFKSKEQIFEDLVTQLLMPGAIGESWLPEDDVDLPTFVDIYIDRMYAKVESPDFLKALRLLMIESERVPDLVRRWQENTVSAMQQQHQEYIDACVARGIARASVMTECFFTLATSPVTWWVLSKMTIPDSVKRPISLAQLRELHRRLLLEMLEPR